jgi:hypothetical protein
MSYQLVRMPTDNDELNRRMTEFAPFLDAMYTEHERELFGELDFSLAYWFMLWDTGAGNFLARYTDAGELVFLAMITKCQDLWNGKWRMEVHRTAVSSDPSIDGKQEVENALKYLRDNAGLLEIDRLYFTNYYDDGREEKLLVWKV